MYTFTYLYNFHILHNTVFQRTQLDRRASNKVKIPMYELIFKSQLDTKLLSNFFFYDSQIQHKYSLLIYKNQQKVLELRNMCTLNWIKQAQTRYNSEKPQIRSKVQHIHCITMLSQTSLKQPNVCFVSVRKAARPVFKSPVVSANTRTQHLCQFDRI